MINIKANNCEGIETKRILFQFDDFLKHEGKLPSCSIFLHSNTRETIPTREHLLKTVGNYDFYSETEGYSIGYRYLKDDYALLKTDKLFSALDVYYKEPFFERTHSEVANLLYIAYRYRAVLMNAMMIHAAAIIYNGEAILFCGPSGAGKSTAANSWKSLLGAEILNYDKPCILIQGDSLIVQGTPWSGKEGIYKNKYVPLKAIVFVNKNNNNVAIRMTESEAFTLLYLNNYLYPINSCFETEYYSLIQQIVHMSPVYKLDCTIGKEAVHVLFKEIYGVDCFL